MRANRGTRPFVKRFESDHGTKYVYDVQSNEIVRVDPALYDLLGDSNHQPADEAIGRWATKHTEKNVRRAVGARSRAHTQGLFRSRPSIEMDSVLCDTCYEEKADTQRDGLTLCMTEKCNMRCVYCSHSGLYPLERPHSNAQMSRDTAKRAIEYFLSTSTRNENPSISFYGGEPSLQFDLIQELVSYAKTLAPDREVDFHLDTNGLLLRRSVVDFVLKHQMFLQVSVDGPSEIHDRYRKTRGGADTFDVIMSHLLSIRERDADYFKNRVRFSVTLSPPYHLDKVERFFEQDVFDGMVLASQFVEPCDTSFYEKFASGDDHQQQALQIEGMRKRYMDCRVSGGRPTKLARNFFEPPLVSIHKRQRKPMRGRIPCNGNCVPGVRKLFVDVHGNYYPCERVGGSCQLGDVDHGVSKKAAKKLVEDYIEMSETDCSKCWASRLCGMCFATSRRGDKLAIDSKRKACVAQRDHLGRSLQTYVSILEANPQAFDFVKDMVIR